MPDLEPTLTHPETAWLMLSVPLWIAVAGVLALALGLRTRLLRGLDLLLLRWSARHRHDTIEPALIYTARITSPLQLFAVIMPAFLAVLIGLSFIAPILAALVLAAPILALLIWCMLLWLEARYTDQLDRQLPPAVGRLGAILRSGASFQAALTQIVADLPDSPLRTEWAFLLERLGAPLEGGLLATPTRIAAALALQTPSARHAQLLGHLEVALAQTHDVLVQRIQAAGAALYASEQRRSAAATELAQMRYSGLVIGLAGLVTAVYLMITQHERVVRAYQGPIGATAAVVVIVALVAPVLAGILLSRADDLEY
jgi:Flp pilus assembly protein TadB